MAKSVKLKKLVIIKHTGPLPEVGHILGPVLHPYNLEIEVIRKLVSNRKKVFEVNPANHDEKIELTLKNLENDNFSEANKAATTDTGEQDNKTVEDKVFTPAFTIPSTKEEAKKEAIVNNDVKPQNKETEKNNKQEKSDFVKSK